MGDWHDSSITAGDVATFRHHFHCMLCRWRVPCPPT